MSKTQDDINDDVAGLRREVARLNQHRFMRIHNSTSRLLWFQFLRGLAFGLGTVLGATVLVSILALALSKIDFLPIIGDWAKEIAAEMNNGK